MRVHILALDTGHEPHALRAACECWGAEVTATWVGNSAQIVDFLSGKPPHDLILLAGHGAPDAVRLPPLEESVAATYPYRDRITATQFRAFVRLEGACVVSLCCESGTPAMADAFLSGGASLYIGPSGSPDGSAALMYALELLYAVLVERKPPGRGHADAIRHADDRAGFVAYGPGSAPEA